MLVARVHSFNASDLILLVINWWVFNKSTVVDWFLWYCCGEQVTLTPVRLSSGDDSTPSSSQSSESLTKYCQTLHVWPWSIDLSKLHMAGACFDPSNSIDNFAMWMTLKWMKKATNDKNKFWCQWNEKKNSVVKAEIRNVVTDIPSLMSYEPTKLICQCLLLFTA